VHKLEWNQPGTLEGTIHFHKPDDIMHIWLITIGEPLPFAPVNNNRLHRTGIFANILANNSWDVTWWTSTFDHFRKHHFSDHDEIIQLNNALKIIMLHGFGYKSNLSLARIRDQRQIAKKFTRLAPNHPRPDIILCSYPPIELGTAAINFGKKYQVPVVLDMRDMWPDIFVDHVPSLLRPIAKIFAAPMFNAASKACAGASVITGITEVFVNWGLAKGKKLPTSLDKAFPMGYVSLHPTEDKIKDAESYWDSVGITRDTKDFIICFIGTIGRQFDLATVISSAREIINSGRRIKFIFCGTGDRLINFKQSAADLPNILFPGWVDAAKIFVLMRRSAIGLDPLPDRYDFLSTINNKAIEYLSAGLPIISSPDRGVLCELLKVNGCGISYPTGNADALVETIIRLYDDRITLQKFSNNASRLFKEKFTAEKVYKEMMEHLAIIAENSKHN